MPPLKSAWMSSFKITPGLAWRTEELNLRSNEIEDQGNMLISSNENWKNLKKANLTENKIDEEVGAELGNSTTSKNLNIYNESRSRFLEN